jgi:hypothetical protein
MPKAREAMRQGPKAEESPDDFTAFSRGRRQLRGAFESLPSCMSEN